MNGERGTSFTELLVSLALLGVVVVSLCDMLVFGARQVNSGRNDSEALSVARAILEEMHGWGFKQTYLNYGRDGSTTSDSIDTRTNGYASKWQPALERNLSQSYAVVGLDALGDPVPNLNAAKAIRAVVTVHWREGARQRSLQLGTVRM